jgi:hypothetical protein
MYTGTLIDELISAFEQAENYTHKSIESQKTKAAYWYTPTERERAFDSKVLGVA